MSYECMKLLAGELHRLSDAEIQHGLTNAHEWLTRYKSTPTNSSDCRASALRRAERAPFSGRYCDYGIHIRSARRRLRQSQLGILDVALLTIYDRRQIGRAALIYGADHPRSNSRGRPAK
jgi:hypothetical protein